MLEIKNGRSGLYGAEHLSECKCVVEAQRPTRHIIGHSGDDFYRPDDQTNSVKALKERTAHISVLLTVSIVSHNPAQSCSE